MINRPPLALRHSRELFARLPEAQRPPDPEQLLASIDRLAEGQLWQEIEARLSTLDTLVLPEILVIKVLMKRGAVEVRRGRLMEARAVLQDVLRLYPQGAHLAEAYYLLGTVYQRQNQPANSIQAYEMGLAQPSTVPWTAKTLWALARLQEERQELARALDLYQRLAQDFPTHEQAEPSLWQAGWMQYCQRQLPGCYHASGKASNSAFHARHGSRRCSTGRRGPPSREGIKRWRCACTSRSSLITRCTITPPRDTPTCTRLARALRTPLARSCQSLRCSCRTLLCSRNHPSSHPAKRTSISSACRNCNSYRCINRQGKKSAASRRCCPALRPRSTPSPPSISITSNMWQPSAPLNSVLEALSPAEVRGLPRDFWTTLYPQLFWPEVSQLAQAISLNPYLVLSIIRQESAFNPAAISSAGARGLMQLMPATAQEVLTKLKLPPGTGRAAA